MLAGRVVGIGSLRCVGIIQAVIIGVSARIIDAVIRRIIAPIIVPTIRTSGGPLLAPLEVRRIPSHKPQTHFVHSSQAQIADNGQHHRDI